MASVLLTIGSFGGVYSVSVFCLTPRSRILPEKLTGPQLVKKFCTLYGTRRSITAFTSSHHLSLSWARVIQSMPSHSTAWRYILKLSYHILLGLPSGFFPLGLPTITLYAALVFLTDAACPAHLLNFITRIIFGEEYRCRSSSLHSHLHSPIYGAFAKQIFNCALISYGVLVCPHIRIQELERNFVRFDIGKFYFVDIFQLWLKSGNNNGNLYTINWRVLSEPWM